LSVRVLVSNSLLEGSHGLLGSHCLGSDDVGDFEVQGNVLPAILVSKGSSMSWAGKKKDDAHKLLLVALSICSSRAVLAEDDHQLIIAIRNHQELLE
jgi:hypothetical protein